MSLVNLKTPWGDVVCPAWEHITELGVRWLASGRLLFKGEKYSYYDVKFTQATYSWDTFSKNDQFKWANWKINVSMPDQLRLYEGGVVDLDIYFENSAMLCTGVIASAHPTLDLDTLYGGLLLYGYEFSTLADSKIEIVTR